MDTFRGDGRPDATNRTKFSYLLKLDNAARRPGTGFKPKQNFRRRWSLLLLEERCKHSSLRKDRNPMTPVGLTWREAHTVDPDLCQLDQSKRRLFRYHTWPGIGGEEGFARKETTREYNCLMLGTVPLRSHQPTGNDTGRNQFVPTRRSRHFPRDIGKCAGSKQMATLKFLQGDAVRDRHRTTQPTPAAWDLETSVTLPPDTQTTPPIKQGWL